MNDPQHKLILRPLSDLVKEIEVGGDKIVPLVKLAKTEGVYYDDCKYALQYIDNYNNTCGIKINDVVLGYDDIHGFGKHYYSTKEIDMPRNPLKLYRQLYEWHFDINNLIEQGLAIDINTLEE